MRQQKPPLFDDLVGSSEYAQRDHKAERPGGFHVDNQLEFSGLDDREVRRFLAFENATVRAPTC